MRNVCEIELEFYSVGVCPCPDDHLDSLDDRKPCIAASVPAE